MIVNNYWMRFNQGRGGVISQSRRLRLVTLTKTLIILDTCITKTESNNCFIIH